MQIQRVRADTIYTIKFTCSDKNERMHAPQWMCVYQTATITRKINASNL